MPTPKINCKNKIEERYFILNFLPFVHHLHGNSHLEESVKPLVFLHYHSYKKVASQFLLNYKASYQYLWIFFKKPRKYCRCVFFLYGFNESFVIVNSINVFLINSC